MRRRSARGCATWPASAAASATAARHPAGAGRDHDEPQEALPAVARGRADRSAPTRPQAGHRHAHAITIPQAGNQRWSLDFVADVLSWGRRFRVLAIVDDFTREALALVVDSSIGGRRVVRELDALMPGAADRR